jgi:uncharacterized protein (TIGR01777 family)
MIMDTILIGGGTGLIGQELARRLKEKGYNIALLSRNNKKDIGFPVYHWDPDISQIDEGAISAADYIVNLAGANIGERRWTPQRRKLILESRVKSGALLLKSVCENGNKLKAFISASATGYYGAVTSDKIFSEADPPANDFLGETCRKWELSADMFEEHGIRTVKIRTGVVLSRHGGALAKMTIPVKMGFGSAFGNGRQYLPWIHIADLCDIYIRAIEDSNMSGSYDAVAPEHKTNKDFTRCLAQVLKKPFWFPDIPAIFLKAILGEMSAVLLQGSRVSSEKITATGYKFRFPDLETALNDLYRG